MVIGDLSSGIITRKKNWPDYAKMIANVYFQSMIANVYLRKFTWLNQKVL